MEQRADRIRREISRLVPHRTTQPIPYSIRREAIALVLEERKRGSSWPDISSSIGICETTIRRWLSQEEKKDIADWGELVPVGVRPEIIGVVKPGEDKSKLTIVTPSGFRLQGFGLEDAIYLMRELS